MWKGWVYTLFTFFFKASGKGGAGGSGSPVETETAVSGRCGFIDAFVMPSFFRGRHFDVFFFLIYFGLEAHESFAYLLSWLF